MAGDGDYFGYTTSGNDQLNKLKIQARHMGENVTHYPVKESSGQYPSDTINWDDPKLSGDQKGNETGLLAADSIERIRKRMLAQDPTAMYQLGDKWFRIVRVIDDIRERVLNAALGLQNGGDGSPGNHGGWQGKGAEAFLARGPGATIKSLDDWKSAAMANWMGTLALAQAIPNHQYKINELYDQYKKAMVSYSADWKKKYGVEDQKLEDLNSSLKDQYVADLKNLESWWSIQARQIQYGMAKEYHSVMNGELRGGSATVYEGPTDAVQPDPQFLARALMGTPSLPGVTRPNVGSPNIGKPNISAPNPHNLRSKPDLKAPQVTKPSFEIQKQVKPETPNLTAPTVPPPSVAPPVPPPVPVGKQPLGLRGSPGLPPSAPSVKGGPDNLLNNIPGKGQSVPSVLGRSAVNPGQVPNTGTPSMPQSPMKGQPGAPPQSPMKGKPPSEQLKGRGQVQRPGAPQGSPGAPNPGGRGAPGAPSTGRGQRAPGGPTPGASRVPGQPNQFGGPPSSASSPVLRAPGSPQAPSPGVPGSQSPPRPGATSPVLNRPKPSKPVAATPPSPLLPPTARNSEFAPPSMPTSRPVVGRSTRLVAGPEQDRPSGVLRGNRRAKAGYEAQIGSRRKGAEDTRSTVDEEFDKIRQILDREEAWTVSTPGGGVLDSAPTQRVSPASEPRPTLGTSPANG